MEEFEIFPFTVARTDSPAPRVFYLGDPEEKVPTDYLFWLLKGTEHNVLVDTGFTSDYCVRYMPELRQRPEEHPEQHLRRAGITLDQVDHIVLTHAHFDHLSDIVFRYTSATIYLQKQEYEFTMNPPHPWFQELVDLDTLKKISGESEGKFILVDGDSDIIPGISVILTPGHTFGHQSVIANTAKGSACLAGDAAFFYRSLEEDLAPGFNCNLIDALSSLKRLRKLKEQGVIVLPGHDPTIFLRYEEMPIF